MTEKPSLLSTISIRYIIIVAVIILALIPVLVFLNVVPAEQQVAVNITMDQSGNVLLLHHTGGEALDKNLVSIRIDNSPVPKDQPSLTDGQDWPWSIGKTLAVPLTPDPVSRVITVWYGKDNSNVMVFSGTILPVTTPVTTVPTPAVTETIVSPTSMPTMEPVTPVTITQTPTAVPAPEQTPAVPIADFDAVPRSGSAPLTVIFEDRSTGIPESWEWTFGDNTTSDIQNPIHSYANPGTYTVSLNAKNSLGANVKIRQGFIVAESPAPRQEIFLEGDRDGHVLPGVVQFRVNGDNSRIKVGGRWIYPADGDIVRIEIDMEERGILSVSGPFITRFEFPSATVYVNGATAGSGSLTEIRITSFEDFLSSLSVSLPAAAGSGRVIFEGTTRPLEDYHGTITISHLYPDSTGTLTLDTYLPGRIKVQGSAEQIMLSKN